MNNRLLLLLMVFTAILFIANAGALADRTYAYDSPALTTDTSLRFIPNVGQFPDQVTYQIGGSRLPAWLSDDSIWLNLTDADSALGLSLRLRFVGLEPSLEMQPFARQSGVAHYLGGNSQTDVPIWAGVQWLDHNGQPQLTLAGSRGRLAFDTSRPINLELTGARVLAIEGGVARIQTALGPAQIPLPLAPAGGQLVVIDNAGGVGRWALPVSEGETTSTAPQANGLIFSTFIGGELLDRANAIALDDEDAAYVTGHTQSLIFPAEAGVLTPMHGVDVYIAKLDATGAALEYVTWVNPNPGQPDDADYAYDIAVNDAGNAFVVGSTLSPEFCAFLGSPPGFDTTHNGNDDAFMIRLTPDGSEPDFCSYIGGDEADIANAVAVDDADNIWVGGGTWSADFPATPGSYNTRIAGQRDAFVVRFDSAGIAQSFGTFIGGAEQEEITRLVLDSAGNAYATGWTSSSDFPATSGAFQEVFGGVFDAFALKLSSDGSDLEFATYLGGETEDRGWAIQRAPGGRLFLTGQTLSADFPTTPGSYDTGHNGDYDLFITAVDAAGSNLVYSTYYGGADTDIGRALALDGSGGVYFTGETSSNDLPISSCPFDDSLDGGIDALVGMIVDGHSLQYGSYLGGDIWDYGNGIRLNQAGQMVLTGRSLSADFPTTPDAYDPQHNGDYDIFISGLTTACLQKQRHLFLPLVPGQTGAAGRGPLNAASLVQPEKTALR